MMRIILGLSIILSISFSQMPSEENDACIACHQLLDEDRDDGSKILTHFYNDVHYKKGLSCADCHGGDRAAFDDEDASMWDADNFKGKISRQEQPDMCAGCHSNSIFMRQYTTNVKTDQAAQYWTSQHGIDLKAGKDKVAVCGDCHGLHGMFEVKDPRSKVYASNIPATCSHCHSNAGYMQEFDIPIDQYEKYARSVHGDALLNRNDIGAPACNDCHGNHGAVPPSISHISDICGTCHLNNQKLFQESHLGGIFLENGLGQCEGCHNNHEVLKPTDESLIWEEHSLCKKCHEDGGNAKQLSEDMYTVISSLRNKLESAKDRIHTAERKGMEVSDLFVHLEDVNQALIHTRTSIHSFNAGYVKETAESGFKAAQLAITGAEEALDGFDYRRKGLFVASLIISLLVVLLYLKIRQMEQE